MDTETILQMSGMSAGSVTIVLILYRFMKSLRGKKFVSTCCGRKAEMGFDVREMSPSPTENKIAVLIDGTPNQERRSSTCDGSAAGVGGVGSGHRESETVKPVLDDEEQGGRTLREHETQGGKRRGSTESA